MLLKPHHLMNQNANTASGVAGPPLAAGTLATLRNLPRPVWILFAGTFLNKFGTFVIPFLALYMTRLGFSTTQAGLAIGAYGVGLLVASTLGGHLADTIGRRKTIVLSMFSAAVAMLLLSQARTFTSIVLLTALAGLTGDLYRPASSALLADLVPAEQRVTAFAALRVAFNAGWAFGPATAGFLAAHSFFWLFVGDAVTSALFGVVALTALPRGIRKSEANGHWAEAFRLAARDRRFLQLLAASWLIAPVFFQMNSTFALHVTKSGFSAAAYGALISMNGVLVVLFELPLTSITRKLSPRRVMAVGYLLIGGGFAFNAISHSLATLAGSIIILTFGEMIAMPVSAAYVAELAPANYRGRCMGLLGLAWALALACGPSLGMILFERSATTLWIACGGLGVLAALIISLKVEARAIPSSE